MYISGLLLVLVLSISGINGILVVGVCSISGIDGLRVTVLLSTAEHVAHRCAAGSRSERQIEESGTAAAVR